MFLWMRTMNKCVLLPHLDVIKVLWDLDPNKGALKMIEGKMGDAVHYASFCPTSADRVCVSGNGQLSMWVYEQSFTVRWSYPFLKPSSQIYGTIFPEVITCPQYSRQANHLLVFLYQSSCLEILESIKTIRNFGWCQVQKVNATCWYCFSKSVNHVL